jgi:lipoprotein NlpD
MKEVFMTGFFCRTWWLSGVAVLALSACGSKPMNRAPVEDRGIPPAKVEVESRSEPAKPAVVLDAAGKSVFYTVKPKDTLIGIGLESGQSHKDIARWNNLENPNRIEIGQVLRVSPPVGENVAVTKPVATGSVTATAIAAGPAKPASAPSSQTAATPTSANGVSTPVVVAPVTATGPAASPPSLAAEDDIGWIWPGNGPVLAGFDEAKNKGLDIGGTAGDPVLASADGKVVYAGAGLRGYGNLIILKHNNVYLTAYAHNQALLVKEDQSVKKGQKIAEMGNSDADRVKLHFEVRRQGKPVDPAKYLPAR